MNRLLSLFRAIDKTKWSTPFVVLAIVGLLLCVFVGTQAFWYGQRLASSTLLSHLEKSVLAGSLVISANLFIAVLYSVMKRKFASSAGDHRRSLRVLKLLIDLVPPPRLRRRLLKLLADQSAHVTQLKKAKRRLAAYWIVLTTWVLVVWYVLLSPIHALWGGILSPLRGVGD